MSTVSNPVFQQSAAVVVQGSNFTATQVDIEGVPGYIGRDWYVYGTGWKVNLTNRVIFTPGAMDESKELRITTSFPQLSLPFAVGDYTTPQGGVMPANKQRINLVGTFRSNTSGFADKTNSITMYGGLTYHWFGSNYYQYGSYNTLPVQNVSYSYDPSTGTDTLTTLLFRIRGVETENTSNHSFQASYEVYPRLDGTATSYYLGNLYIIDGIGGDTPPNISVDSTMTCSAGVIHRTDDTLTATATTDIAASNLVAFPQEIETLYWIDEGYFLEEFYAGPDYFVQGYMDEGYYVETTPGFQAGGIMTQLESSDFQLYNLAGILWTGYSQVSADFASTALGYRVQQIASSVSSEFNTQTLGGMIWKGWNTYAQADFSTLFSSGRIQSLETSLFADYGLDSGTFIFVEQGGEGIVSASSGIAIEGGYLQSSGSLTLTGDGELAIQFDTGSSAGIILEGWNVYADADTNLTSLGGRLYTSPTALTAEWTLDKAQPGYLWAGILTASVDTAINSITSIVYVQQSFMSAEFTVPRTLAGLGVFGDAHFYANNFQLVSGRLWVIDPYRVLVVPQELRLDKVIPEARLLAPDDEQRLLRVLQETGVLAVEQETRNLHIPIAPVRLKNDIRTERV